MIQFLWGALAMACLAASLFFLRFWRQTHDRLFFYFFLAFTALCANWTVLSLTQHGVEEPNHHAYWLRLLAFVLILVGVIGKNRRGD